MHSKSIPTSLPPSPSPSPSLFPLTPSPSLSLLLSIPSPFPLPPPLSSLSLHLISRHTKHLKSVNTHHPLPSSLSLTNHSFWDSPKVFIFILYPSPSPPPHTLSQTTVSGMLKGILEAGEPEDSHAHTHWRAAILLPVSRLQQVLLQLFRPLQAPEDARGTGQLRRENKTKSV